MAVNLIPDHDWGPVDFAGGALCLNFTNTRGGHHKIRENDRLASYGDMLRFALAANAVDAREAAALQKLMRSKPKEAAQRLEEARAFREALSGVLAALVIGHEAKAEPPATDLSRMREAMSKAIAEAKLSLQDGAFAWSLDLETLGLGLILARVALSAQQFLTQESPSRIRQCERCTGFYLDTSKNQRRRWCTPDICGNRTRASRHYEKIKTTGS